jgi:very-short-patch-repair endonuclease
MDAVTVMSPGVVAKIAQDWMAQKVLRPGVLHDALARARRHRGVGELRRLLADADIGDVDSVPEGDLGRILRSAKIAPVRHHLATTSSGSTFELDWSYPPARIGLELDGYGVHLRSSDAFENDRLRRNELELSGWMILNFTRRMCRYRPDRVVDQVRRALSMPRTAQ